MSSKQKRPEEDRESESSDDDDDGFGPAAPVAAGAEEGGGDGDAAEKPKKKKKKKRRLEHEEAYVAALPSAEMYEKSYMHRDVVTHAAFTPRTDFLVTGSLDGHVKFWKKMPEGLEFVKHYHAHLGSVRGLAVSADGLRLATTGEDKAIKFYDVLTFDLTFMIDVGYAPSHCCWIHRPGEAHGKLVVADADSPCLRVYRTDGAQEPVKELPRLHSAPVTALAFSSADGIVVSADAKGVIEYWTPEEEYGFPRGKVAFKVCMYVPRRGRREGSLCNAARTAQHMAGDPTPPTKPNQRRASWTRTCSS